MHNSINKNFLHKITFIRIFTAWLLFNNNFLIFSYCININIKNAMTKNTVVNYFSRSSKRIYVYYYCLHKVFCNFYFFFNLITYLKGLWYIQNNNIT